MGAANFAGLKRAFNSAMGSNAAGLEEAAVLFSGGLDSALVAKAVSERVGRTMLFSVGMPGSKDPLSAKKIAGEMNLPLALRVARKSEIAGYAKKTKSVLGSLADSWLQVQIAVPEFIALEHVKKSGFRTFFSGQGSDELFCGYSSFKKVLEEGGHASVESEIARLLGEMQERNLRREQLLAGHFSLAHKMPFLDAAFVREALKIPAREKIFSPDDSLRKHPLRAIARELGVPESACMRPKKAIQYGSGIAEEIRRLRKQ